MNLTDPTPISEGESGIRDLQAIHPFASKMPPDTEWFSGTISAADVRDLVHIFAPVWAALSNDSGQVAQSAISIEQHLPFADEFEMTANSIREIAANFDTERLGRLLLGANGLEEGPFMVLDGNHRAVALELLGRRDDATPPAELVVVVALSRSVQLYQWG